MTDFRPILIPAVERATKELLDYFHGQYGGLIFAPLGVGPKTPGKIAPTIAESIQTTLLAEEGNNVSLVLTDEKVGQVFDSFINSFFNSLNFIAKGTMKLLGMKMMWSDFSQQLAKHKTWNPNTYQTWKNNLTMVLEGVFTAVKTDLEASGKSTILTNGELSFETVKDAVEALAIFQ